MKDKGHGVLPHMPHRGQQKMGILLGPPPRALCRDTESPILKWNLESWPKNGASPDRPKALLQRQFRDEFSKGEAGRSLWSLSWSLCTFTSSSETPSRLPFARVRPEAPNTPAADRWAECS